MNRVFHGSSENIRSLKTEHDSDQTPTDRYKRIRQGIWLYFFLLVFEGALRKWITPGFSTPLLIVRDPIAIWLIIASFQKGVFKVNFPITLMWGIGFIALIPTLLAGHGNMLVALFGLRVLVLHFPLIFIIGRVFYRQDVIKMGKALLWIAIPMTYLMILQFYSSQSEWVNRGLAGNEVQGFTGAIGYFRPSGTFSFITGLTQFFGLVAAFVFYFWLDTSKLVKRWLLLTATGCVVMSIPFSISRTLFFSIVITFIFAVIASTRKPKYAFRFVGALAAGLLLVAILSNIEFFQIGVEAFSYRLQGANEYEGGANAVFFDRFLGGMIGAILGSNSIPIFGYGLGTGTNAGSAILTGTASGFNFSEGEWGRLIGEMGLILGMGVILVRFSLAAKMIRKSVTAMRLINFLPWMLMSFAFLNLIQGQWAQPTSLGFAVLSGGLVLASFKDKKKSEVLAG